MHCCAIPWTIDRGIKKKSHLWTIDREKKKKKSHLWTIDREKKKKVTWTIERERKKKNHLGLDQPHQHARAMRIAHAIKNGHMLRGISPITVLTLGQIFVNSSNSELFQSRDISLWSDSEHQQPPSKNRRLFVKKQFCIAFFPTIPSRCCK